MKFFRALSQYRRSARNLVQLSLDDWPDGASDVAFTLKRRPEQLARKLNIRFQSDHDDLDVYDAAVLEIPGLASSGKPRRVVFQIYRNDPERSIHVLPDIPNDLMIHFLVRHLGIKEREVGWAAPFVRHQMKREWMPVPSRSEALPA